jgi:hypothetical protein
MKFRKKPVVIEAMQVTGNNTPEILEFCPDAYIIGNMESKECFNIKTLEGTMLAIPGDWIIKGVKGEFYPCKPDIFEQTYERVEDD